VVMAIGLVITFQLLFTYLPPMQTLFGTAALDSATWLRIVAVSFSVFVLVELEKFFFNLLEHRKADR
jgi:magnesium-transporting ATPase (P-type)